MLLTLVTAVSPPSRAEAVTPVLLTPANTTESADAPTFTWEAIPDAQSYRFQISTAPNFSSRHYEAVLPGTALTLPQAKELGVNVPYYWRVAATMPDGTLSDYSTSFTFTRVKPVGPELLAPLPTEGSDVAVVTYPNPPTLQWSAIPGAEDYTVQWSTDPGFSSGVTSKATAGTALVLSALAVEGTNYFWRVRANLVNGVTTDYSTASQFEVLWPDDLRPTILYPRDEVELPWNQLHFAWTPVPGAAKYQVQISPDDQFQPSDSNTWLINEKVSTTHFVPRSTPPDDTYYWRVRALSTDATRPGPWSVGTGPDGLQRVSRVYLHDGLSARPTVWPGVQSDRPDLTGGGPGVGTRPWNAVSLSWTPVPGASYYEVQIAESSSFIDSTPVDDDVLACKTPHTTLTPDASAGAYKQTGDPYPCSLEPPSSGNPDTLQRTGVWITQGRTYYVRVRAVDESTDGTPVPSLWSNDPRPNETIPATLALTLTANGDAGTALDSPATKLTPANGSQFEDAPTLTWRPVAGATRYLVALSVNSAFTTRETTTTHFTVTGTQFVPPQSLLDNEAGKPFYWFVLPCAATCAVGDNAGIPTAWTFTKSSRAVQNLTSTSQRSLAERADPGAVGLSEATPCAAGANSEGAGVNGLCLSWTDTLSTSLVTPGDGVAAGTRHYQVQISTDPTFTAAAVLDTTTDATALIPEARLDDSTYYWRVRARDGGGLNGPWSTAATFTRPAPAKPVLQPAVGSPQPRLTWDAVAGAASYQVEIYAGSDLTGDPMVAAGTSAAPYPGHAPLVDLSRGDYTWRVRAKDGFGVNGPWSDPGDFTVETAAATQTAPTPAAVVPDRDLRFGWTAVPGAAGYRFDLSTRTDFSSLTETATVTGTSWEPRPATLAAGVYYWRVRPLNAAGNPLSPLAADANRRTVTVQTRPGLATGVLGTGSAASGLTQIAVGWTAPAETGGADLSGYRVRYRPSGAAQWSVQTTSGVATATTLTGLTPATDYEIQVAAVNAVGVGRFSSTREVRTPGPPSAPGGLAVKVGYGQAEFSWRAPATNGSAITAYRVGVTPVGEATAYREVLPATQGGPVPTSTVITGLAGGGRYTFSVAASNAVGRGVDAVAEATIPVQPGKPVSVTARRGDRSLVVGWQPPANAVAAGVTGYLIERRSLSRAGWTAWATVSATQPATARTYALTNLTNGTQYQVRVTAKAATGPGVAGDPVVGVPAGRPAAPSVTLTASSGKLVMKWTRPAANGAALSGFVVQTSPNNSTWKTVAAPGPAVVTYAWKVPKRGATYYARVAAKNAMGLGKFSTVRSLRVP